jgi:hypothetical protein
MRQAVAQAAAWWQGAVLIKTYFFYPIHFASSNRILLFYY